jgi:hypothetical protein
MKLLSRPGPPRNNGHFYIPYHCRQTRDEWQKYLPPGEN